MKKSTFFANTAILTVSNIITGTLTFVFTILLSKRIGSEGMGLYQLVMPLYNLFLFITGGGITVSMSKIAAEKKASSKLNELYKTIKYLCILEIFWSIFITILIFLSAGFVSKYFLSDSRTYYSILAFCPALIIISISSIYKGTYYGIQKITEPAIIDVVEKIVRITLIIVFLAYTTSKGIEISVASAVLSLSLGELSSLILFYICFHIYKRNHPQAGKCENGFQLSFNVLKLSLPLALNGILATLFGSLTTVIIPKRLVSSGMNYEKALSLFGKLQGMALNIAFYPMIIIASLNILIIPSISEAVAFKKNNLINRRINTALKFTSAVAFASAALLLLIPFKLANFFFKDNEVGLLIKYISFSIPFVYIEGSSFAIMNGLGKQSNLLINSIILSIIDLINLYILLGIPSINIKGYAINLFISSIIGIILNFKVIKSSINCKLNYFNIIILPLLCCVISYFIGIILVNIINNIIIFIIILFIIFSTLYLAASSLSKK